MRNAQKLALLLLGLFVVATLHARQPVKTSWIAPAIYDGVTISCDLPDDQQMKNIGSKIDGAGMCVFTSIEVSARYQGLESMRGFRDWAAKNFRGGGYPAKVDDLLKKWFKAKGIEPIPYVQYTGVSPEQLLQLAAKTNRMISMTYGYSPRYGRTYIAHMVNGILYEKYGVVLDNNFPGEKNYEWMSPQEFVKRMRTDTSGRLSTAWVFIWATPGAPPPPRST